MVDSVFEKKQCCTKFRSWRSQLALICRIKPLKSSRICVPWFPWRPTATCTTMMCTTTMCTTTVKSRENLNLPFGPKILGFFNRKKIYFVNFYSRTKFFSSKIYIQLVCYGFCLGLSRNTRLFSSVTSSIIAVTETCNKPRAIRVFTKVIDPLS